MRRSTVVSGVILLAVLSSSPAQAVKIPLGLDGDGITLNAGVLLQPWVQVSHQDHTDAQFFLRRARIIVSGTITPRISFFVDTDMPRFGQGGKFDQPFYIQDALLTGEYVKNHYVDGGFMLIPFAHIALEGATGLFALDYPTIVSKPPDSVGKAWRDMGVQLRGYFLDRRLQYRVGIFAGVARNTTPPAPSGTLSPTTPGFTLNPDGIPRFAGTVRFNLLGRENDFFFKGIYFSPNPILSFGMSADYQRRSTPSADHATDSFAFSGDVFAELPVAHDTELIAQAVYVLHRQGSAMPYNRGQGGFLESGVRWRWLSLLFQGEYFHGDLTAHDQVALHGGVNYWVRQHNANFKFDFGWTRQGDLSKAPDGYSGTLQGQVFF